MPELTGADNYINWKRRIKAYIERTDMELIELSDRLENENQNKQKQWRDDMVMAKSKITLTLSDGPKVQVSTTIDDDNRSTKDIWEALGRAYRMSNTQMVINIEHELEKLRFKMILNKKNMSKRSIIL